MAAAANPTDVVPPRIRRRSPFPRRSDFEQRAPGGLQHLREGTQGLPRKVGFDHLYLTRQHASIFRVPAVEIAPHAAHGSGNDLALGELPSRRLFDQADGLDAEDPWEDDTRRQTLPGEQLGPVQTDRLDPDQKLSWLGRWDRPAFDLQDLGAAGLVDAPAAAPIRGR